MTRLVLARSSSPRLPWMLMMAILSAPAAVAQERQALETIAAGKGAHPIRGAKLRPDGTQIVFAQSFDRKCRLSPESLPYPSLAGTVSGNIRLDVSTMSCPPIAAPPTVDCRWWIEPAPIHDSSCRELAALEPLQGSGLDLEMPPQTGIYELALSCRFRRSGTVTRETFRLFVTYSKPLISVTPAAADWYERASCWGAGFDRQSDENRVVEAAFQRRARLRQLVLQPSAGQSQTAPSVRPPAGGHPEKEHTFRQPRW